MSMEAFGDGECNVVVVGVENDKRYLNLDDRTKEYTPKLPRASDYLNKPIFIEFF